MAVTKAKMKKLMGRNFIVVVDRSYGLHHKF